MSIEAEKAIRVLDAQTALRLLAHAVSNRGGAFVYTRPVVVGHTTPVCSYLTDDDNASCLVGHVLRSFGIPAALIRACGNSVGITTLASRLRSEVGEFRISSAAIHVLMQAQQTQDEGGSWGDALAQAVLAFLHLAKFESMGS